jgi:WD40 repeat protein
MGASSWYRCRLVAAIVAFGGAVGGLAGQRGGNRPDDPDVPKEPKPGAFLRLIPPELQLGSYGSPDESEDRYADRLNKGEPADQLAAARALWRGRSRRYAADVLKFVAGPPPGGPGFRAFWQEVEAASRPEAILKELKNGDYRWATWLAFLRPHKDFVPVLLAGLKGEPDVRAETVLALGNSGDPRGLDPLLSLLKSKDYWEAGEAAQALGYLGGPKAEPALIAALADDNGWRQVHACHALERVGTKAVLPALMKVADSTAYTGELNVTGAAMRAVVAVERREHVSPRVEAATGKAPKPLAVLRGPTGHVRAVAFSPDGKLLASVGDDRKVRVWDPAAGTALAAHAGQARQMTEVAFAGPGAVAAAGWGDDGSVRLLNARTGKVAGTVAVAAGGVDSMAVSPDGRWLAASGGGEKARTRVWDMRTGKAVATLAEAGRALAFSPDGRTLATQDVENTCDIRLWSVPDGNPFGRLRSPTGFVRVAAFSPDGRTLAAGAGWRPRAWDVQTEKEAAAYRCDSEVDAVVFHPDGQRVVTAEELGPVRLWDLKTGKVVVTYPVRGPAALSPEGNLLATGSNDRTDLRLWRISRVHRSKQ